MQIKKKTHTHTHEDEDAFGNSSAIPYKTVGAKTGLSKLNKVIGCGKM